LPPAKFRQVQLNLNVRDLPSRLRGRVENQVMVTEIKDEDQEPDQPVNAANEISKDHNKQFSMNAATKECLSDHNNMTGA